MSGPKELILASGSPRRKELLDSLGWEFSVRVPILDEALLPGEGGEEAVKRLSLEKARAVARDHPGRWIIAADTTVVFDGRILGKPRDRDESLEMLILLNGGTHEVFTGVTVASPGLFISAVEKTEVVFREAPSEMLKAYVAGGEGDDKAGAYGIQGLGAFLVESIRGDYFNVVGLPLCRLGKMLESLGFPLAEQWRTS